MPAHTDCAPSRHTTPSLTRARTSGGAALRVHVDSTHCDGTVESQQRSCGSSGSCAADGAAVGSAIVVADGAADGAAMVAAVGAADGAAVAACCAASAAFNLLARRSLSVCSSASLRSALVRGVPTIAAAMCAAGAVHFASEAALRSRNDCSSAARPVSGAAAASGAAAGATSAAAALAAASASAAATAATAASDCVSGCGVAALNRRSS